VPDPQTPLPFPGKIGADGKREVVYHTLHGKKKRELKDWCSEFGLKVSGTVEMLRNELMAFSTNQDESPRYTGQTSNRDNSP